MIALLWLRLVILASPFKPKSRLEAENSARATSAITPETLPVAGSRRACTMFVTIYAARSVRLSAGGPTALTGPASKTEQEQSAHALMPTVRIGAEISECLDDVRFTSESGHVQCN
jgi:hypothetical protein